MADVAGARINITLAKPIVATLHALPMFMKESLRLRRRPGSTAGLVVRSSLTFPCRAHHAGCGLALMGYAFLPSRDNRTRDATLPRSHEDARYAEI